jgi:hypothetical protein
MKHRQFPIAPIPQDAVGAVRGSTNNCPVATCIYRLYPFLRHVHVDVNRISFTDPRSGLRTSWTTPDNISADIKQWDNGGPAPSEGSILDTRQAYEISPSKDRIPTAVRTSHKSKGIRKNSVSPEGTPRTNRRRAYLARQAEEA